MSGQDLRFGGSVRGYQFFALEESPFSARRDSEVWLVRLTQETSYRFFTFETHGLMTLTSPALNGSSQLAVTGSRTFLPLETELASCNDLGLLASFDRINVRLHMGKATVVVGRQAVTWGVTYFWPAMDLFAPFAPQQVDRDYKAGVDAVRIRIPLGAFSEFEVLGSILGSSLDRDGAAGALLRWNVGRADLGFMGGKFHRDTVAGTFVTANVFGTGLRGEMTWTDSGDPSDGQRDREHFWRGTIGLDRQLSPSLSLIAEAIWNGYGTGSPNRYVQWFDSDRIARGEVTAFGRVYSGTSMTWLLHPLYTLDNTVLINWNDHSTLWVPTLSWSTSNNSTLLFGGQVGFGEGLDELMLPESEYGSASTSAFVSMRIYF